MSLILFIVLVALILYWLKLYSHRGDSAGDTAGPALFWGLKILVCSVLILTDIIWLLIRIL